MAAVGLEVLVGCHNHGIGKRFGHANQACVGETQFKNGLYAVG
jgi:hypothetical protein